MQRQYKTRKTSTKKTSSKNTHKTQKICFAGDCVKFQAFQYSFPLKGPLVIQDIVWQKVAVAWEFMGTVRAKELGLQKLQ